MHFRVHQVVPCVHKLTSISCHIFTSFQFQFARIKSTSYLHKNSSWKLKVIPIRKNFLFLLCSPVFVSADSLETRRSAKAFQGFFATLKKVGNFVCYSYFCRLIYVIILNYQHELILKNKRITLGQEILGKQQVHKFRIRENCCHFQRIT
jgi:hypothetical protein